MLVVVMVIDLAAVWSGLLELDLLDRLAAGEQVPPDQIDFNDTRQALIGFAQLAFYIVAAIFFIAWFHRGYRNVDAIGPQWRRHGTGWAIGGWFVPILSLWRPKQIVNDMWR